MEDSGGGLFPAVKKDTALNRMELTTRVSSIFTSANRFSQVKVGSSE